MECNVHDVEAISNDKDGDAVVTEPGRLGSADAGVYVSVITVKLSVSNGVGIHRPNVSDICFNFFFAGSVLSIL